MGHLSVVIPPDIVDSVTEGSSAQEGGSIRFDVYRNRGAAADRFVATGTQPTYSV